MPVIGTDRAFPKPGGADGIDIRTYVATAIFSALVVESGIDMLQLTNKEVLIAQIIAGSWARADQFLLGG